MGKKLIKENPFERTLWAPGGNITKCPVLNYIRVNKEIFINLLLINNYATVCAFPFIGCDFS